MAKDESKPRFDEDAYWAANPFEDEDICEEADYAFLGSPTRFDFTKGGINYRILSLDDKTLEVASIAENCAYLHIPPTEEHDGRQWRVVAIGGEAFTSGPEFLKIPHTVTRIDSNAFGPLIHYFNTGVDYARIKYIDVDPRNRNFTSIDGVLYDKDVTKLIGFPTKKRHLFIPNTVTKINPDVFRTNYEQETFEVEGFNRGISLKTFSAHGGVLYDYEQTRLLRCPRSLTGELLIPETVIKIEDGACAESGVMWLVLPNSVTEIGRYAFNACTELREVAFSNALTHIGIGAFLQCSLLEDFELPASLSSIGGFAFRGCSALKSVTIPEGITSVEPETFAGCTRLTSVKLPNSVVSIETKAFFGCTALKSLDIPASITTIGRKAFAGCSALTSVKLCCHEVSIDKDAFEPGVNFV